MNPLKIAFTIGGIAALLIPKESSKPHQVVMISKIAVTLLAGFLIAQEAKKL